MAGGSATGCTAPGGCAANGPALPPAAGGLAAHNTPSLTQVLGVLRMQRCKGATQAPHDTDTLRQTPERQFSKRSSQAILYISNIWLVLPPLVLAVVYITASSKRSSVHHHAAPHRSWQSPSERNISGIPGTGGKGRPEADAGPLLEAGGCASGCTAPGGCAANSPALPPGAGAAAAVVIHKASVPACAHAMGPHTLQR